MCGGEMPPLALWSPLPAIPDCSVALIL